MSLPKDVEGSIAYRGHVQSKGWVDWAKDGEPAGTTGLSKRAEAIDVQVLSQGQHPAGYNVNKAPLAAK